MASERVRWGILGCGRIATSAIAPAIRWSENGTLLAVGSRSPARAQAKAEEVGAPRHGDYEAVLADPEIEAVYLGLPVGEHARWARAAAEAGKHVLCEKSLTFRHGDALDLREAFDTRGLRLVEAFMVRHHPQWDRIRRLLADGIIGSVRDVRVWLAGTAPLDDHRFSAELGGGALFDVTCYGVTLARLIVGEEPRRVLASARWLSPGVDESTDAILELSGGARAAIHGSLRSPAEQGAIIVGEHGRIIIDRPVIPRWDPVTLHVERRGGRVAYEVGGANHFLHQVEHFARLVREPETAAAPAEDGVENVAVLSAIARAAAGAGVVELGPVEETLTTRGGIPLRITAPAGTPRAPAVIFMHGLGGDKDTHGREAQVLAAAGLAAVLPDAPHHGDRPGPWLGEMEAARTEDEAHAIFLRLVAQAAGEIPGLVDELLARGHPRVAVAGISLGGFTALAAAAGEPRLAAIASLLGSPDWWDSPTPIPRELASLVAGAPVQRLEAFAPRPLLLITAALDEAVPPAPARRFADALRPRYAATPDALVYREFPASGHMMRADEWRAAWATTLGFLRRALR